MIVFKKLLSEVWGDRRYFVISMVTGALMSLASGQQTILVKNLFDAVSANQRHDLVTALGQILIVAFIAAVCRYYSSFTGQYLSDLVAVALRRKLQKKFLNLNLSYYANYQTGSGGLLSRILNDVGQVQGGLHQMAALFREPILFVILLGRLFYLDWKLTLGLIIMIPLIGAFSRQVARSVQKYSHRAQDEMEHLTTTVKETLDGIRVIQSFGLEREMERRFDKIANGYLKAKMNIQKRSEAASPITEYLATAIFAGLFLYFASDFSNLSGLGDFMSYLTAMLLMSKPVSKIQDSFVRLQGALVSGGRIYEILESLQEVDPGQASTQFPKDWRTIEYKNVGFKYAEDWVLRNFSLKVQKGDVIALVGESGSGKSTVVNLLQRFYEPTEGQILVDGVPLGHFSLESLRSNMALVNQDVFLFNDTVRFNIQSGNLDAPSGNVEASAKAANADGFIRARPDGYDTRVGDRGGSLSGGEKQRVSIARAFYKDAPILILDEATSALDAASELEVQKGLESLMQGRTVFVIAHRLSTVAGADKIVVLKSGKIVESGTHDELVSRGGEYSRFRTLLAT
jgi:ATP-binding cassette, subfamily B, bacterial MsbA